MSNSINNCRFDPNGKKDYKAINPVTPLQQNGAYDISYLVHEIATKDFGYTGTSKYTLTLRNDKMVLQLWDRSDGAQKHIFAKLQLKSNRWELSKPNNNNNAEALKSPNQTTARLAHTLDRISKAYQSANPTLSSPRASESRSATLETHSTTPVVPTEQIEHTLNDLSQKLDHLRTAESEKALGQLRTLVEPLHERIEKLQQEIDTLKKENHSLKGLRKPLEELARDVPQQLHEIKNSIDQLAILLGRIQGKSDNTQSVILQEMRSEIQAMREQLKPLSQAAESLQKEKAQLHEENETLKYKIFEQEQALALKNKLIKDLQQTNQRQAELQQNLQKQLADQTKESADKLKQAEEDIGSRNSTIQSQNQIIQDLQREIEDLKGQLEKSQRQIGQIEPLREQLTVANQKLQKQDRENVQLRKELASAQKANALGTKRLEELEAQLSENQRAHEETYNSLVEAAEKIKQLEEASQNLQSIVIALGQEQQTILREGNDTIEDLKAQLLKSQQELQGVREQATNSSPDEKTNQQLAELQTTYDALLKSVQERQTAYDELSQLCNDLGDENRELSETLQQSKQTAQKVGILEKQNRGLTEKQQFDAEHITTLQKMKTDLTLERNNLEQQIGLLKSQLESAEKTNSMSQLKIQDLGVSLDKKDKELQQERQLTTQAQETALKATQVSKKLQHDLENKITQLTEAEAQLEYTEAYLRNRSKQVVEATRALIDLESEFKEHRKLSKELEEVQGERIRELEQELNALQTAHQENLVSLEEATKREISDKFYKDQNEAFQRRINDLEKELSGLKVKETLYKRNLKTLSSKSSAPTINMQLMENVPSISPLLTAPDSTLLDQAQQLLKVVQTTDQSEHSYQASQLGPMVVNYALLDDKIGNVEEWLVKKESQFPKANLKTKNQLVTNQIGSKPGKALVTSKDHRKIAGDIATAQGKFEKTLQAITQLPQPLTLQSIFDLKSAFIAQELIRFENTVIPLLQRYDSLGEFKENSVSRKGVKTIPQIVDEARQFLTIVRQIKGALFKTLSTKTWIEKK